MSTPVATIADALIEFILSLLRDPSAVEEFDANPTGMLASNGLSDVCADDVRAVAPVVIDRPGVDPSPTPPPPPKPYPNDVIKEIMNITNNFVAIDNRATIVDQSVNQNIWTEGGDVTQTFDNEAVVASGDQSVAAGDDADVDNSQTTVGGDVSIGNETTDVDIDGSFNDNSTDTDSSTETETEESYNTEVGVDVATEDAFNDYTEIAVDTDLEVAPEAEETL